MDYTSQTWRLFFEGVPIVAAFITIVLAAQRAVVTSNDSVRITAMLYMLCSFMLVVAQSSWSWTVFIKKDLLGSDIANVVWTLFNLVTMFSMAYTIRRVEE